MVGDIDESGRLPGPGKFASPPAMAKTSLPSAAKVKSSSSSLRRMPVSPATIRAPKLRLMVVVRATALPA